MTENSQDKAILEAEALEAGDLDARARRRQADRRENFRDEMNKAAKVLFWLAVAGIASLIFTEIYHLVTPMSWHYATEAQQAKIETILFSGALAAIVAEFSKKYV